MPRNFIKHVAAALVAHGIFKSMENDKNNRAKQQKCLVKEPAEVKKRKEPSQISYSPTSHRPRPPMST